MNPFENKAIKFATEEELQHLSELAMGYGLVLSHNLTFIKSDSMYFRYSQPMRCYANFCSSNFKDSENTEIHYSDFIASLEVTEQVPDMVNHPKHYNVEGYEVIDIIRAFGLNFAMGNVLKYILRADRKGNRLQDLKKAAWYLQNEIDNCEKETK